MLIVAIASVGSAGAFVLNNTIPSGNFTLNASGTAFDNMKSQTVTITVSLTGATSGNSKNMINLQVKGGTVNVAGYGQFSVSSGEGHLKQKNQDFWLNIHVLSNAYGGQAKLWTFDGTTTNIQGKVYSVTFTADSETLPLMGTPAITNLVLTGTVTLNP